MVAKCSGGGGSEEKEIRMKSTLNIAMKERQISTFY